MKTKIIHTAHFPFRGFKAITIWPFVFVRKDCVQRFSMNDERHEMIHAHQQVEMLIMPFYLWYGLEWFVRWLCYGFDFAKAYANISFEREAYGNQDNPEYPQYRKRYAFLKYVFRKTNNNSWYINKFQLSLQQIFKYLKLWILKTH